MTFAEQMAWLNWTGMQATIPRRLDIAFRHLCATYCPACQEPPGEACEWYFRPAPHLVLSERPARIVHAVRIAAAWPRLDPAVQRFLLARIEAAGGQVLPIAAP